MKQTQYVGWERPARTGPRQARRSIRSVRQSGKHAGHLSQRRKVHRSEVRGKIGPGVYRKRRALAVVLLLFGALALVFVGFARSSQAAQPEVPINPDAAEPGSVLARAAGVEISTPIRPVDLTGLGYHPDGESLVEMRPRGENLSANPLSRLVSDGSTPEDIRYHVMAPAERNGTETGALDVGAEAGAAVYSPVTGVVTAIRPDPLVSGANVVEIQSSEDPNLRVYVSLVRDISSGVGVENSVKAGTTKLGEVTNSAEVLDPQLSSYTGTTGNHVTVAASKVD